MTAVGRLRALVHDYTAWHARHHQLARVVQYELGALAPDHRDEILRLRRRTEEVVLDEIASGIASGAFRTEDPGGVALAVLSLGVDVSRWYAPGGHHTPVSLGRRYATLVLAMLGTDHRSATAG